MIILKDLGKSQDTYCFRLLHKAGIGILCIGWLFAGLGCVPFWGSTDNSNNNSSSSAKAIEILKLLNVNEVTNPPVLTTTSTTGETVLINNPDSWQPLKTTYAVFNPTAQVLQVGINYNGAYSTLWGNGPDYSTAVPFSGTGITSWANSCSKKIVSTDLDGDGITEWVILFTPTNGGNGLSLTVGHLTAGSTVSFSTPKTVNGITASDKLDEQYERTAFFIGSVPRNTRYPYFQLSSADVDGDGKQEILMVNYKQALVLKISPDGASCTIIESKTYSNPISSFTGGDIDGDGKDEFAICVQEQGFALYDSSFSIPLSNPEFVTSGWSGFSWADVVSQAAFGDFNGDNLDDLVVNVSGPIGWNAQTYQFLHGSLILKHTITNATDFPDRMTNITVLPVAVDIDGNGDDELFLSPIVCSKVLDPSACTKFNIGNTLIPEMDHIVNGGAGDVDADGKEDLVLYGSVNSDGTTSGTIFSRIVAVGVPTGGNLSNLQQKKVYCNTLAGPSNDTAASYKHSVFESCIAIGHSFDNSPRVQYAGHELQFSDPIVIAVLASPPYYADIAAADSSYVYNN